MKGLRLSERHPLPFRCKSGPQLSMKHYSEAERAKLLEDYFDPEKLVLICSQHGYVGGSNKMPKAGCVECSTVFWRHWAAKQPPHKRTEALEQMQELVRKLVENKHELKDITLDPHPTISIEKGKN